MSVRLATSDLHATINLQRLSSYPAIPAPADVPLTVLPEQPCPYLDHRMAMIRALQSGRIDPEIYHDFMDAGFRRSGRMVYQNICRGCRRCTQIRVPVQSFAMTRSQRRCWRRNSEIEVQAGQPHASAEKYDLYRRYLQIRHDGQQQESQQAFESFLYDSPVQTIEFEYRLRGRLIGVGICDLCSRSLSSVYFYFDPAERRRGLGNFGVLQEIEFARRVGIPFYYLGFWVAEAPAMAYKANFGPFQLLGTDGTWRPGN